MKEELEVLSNVFGLARKQMVTENCMDENSLIELIQFKQTLFEKLATAKFPKRTVTPTTKKP